MDNQQERLIGLSWLGGIVDGEGCLCLSTLHMKHQTLFKPLIRIVNTNPTLIDHAFNIFTQEGLAVYRSRTHEKQKLMKNGRQWKKSEQLLVQGVKRVKATLDVLQPYLVAKRPQAEVLLAFCNYRLGVTRDTPYGEYEASLVDKNRLLNQTGEESSETTRRASTTEVVKI